MTRFENIAPLVYIKDHSSKLPLAVVITKVSYWIGIERQSITSVFNTVKAWLSERNDLFYNWENMFFPFKKSPSLPLVYRYFQQL